MYDEGDFWEKEEEPEEDFWEAQSRLPLRQRNSMWWAGVALPTTLLLAWAVATVLWILGVL